MPVHIIDTAGLRESSDPVEQIGMARTWAAIETADLAVLVIPESGVLEAVQKLAARDCRAAVLFASGYAEAGEEGQAKQAQLTQLAREAGIALVGPNCMGFTNLSEGIPITFEPGRPLCRFMPVF